jgi:hypothetical protein
LFSGAAFLEAYNLTRIAKLLGIARIPASYTHIKNIENIKNIKNIEKILTFNYVYCGRAPKRISNSVDFVAFLASFARDYKRDIIAKLFIF